MSEIQYYYRTFDDYEPCQPECIFRPCECELDNINTIYDKCLQNCYNHGNPYGCRADCRREKNRIHDSHGTTLQRRRYNPERTQWMQIPSFYPPLWKRYRNAQVALKKCHEMCQSDSPYPRECDRMCNHDYRHQPFVSAQQNHIRRL